MTREELAALAQKTIDELTLPDGVRAAIIVTDESGAFIGVGSNCTTDYTNELIWYAVHGEDRVDHFVVGRKDAVDEK